MPTNNITAGNLSASTASIGVPSFSPPVILGDYVLDLGMATFHNNCDRIYVCTGPITDFASVVATAVGYKVFGAGNAFGGINNGSPSGRVVSSISFTDGSITANGFAICWAAVDFANSQLLAWGVLSGDVLVVQGQLFGLPSFTIHEYAFFAGANISISCQPANSLTTQPNWFAAPALITPMLAANALATQTAAFDKPTSNVGRVFTAFNIVSRNDNLGMPALVRNGPFNLNASTLSSSGAGITRPTIFSGAVMPLNATSIVASTISLDQPQLAGISAGWLNMSFPAQTASFIWSFDAVPSLTGTADIVFGLSNGAAIGFTSAACLVAFNTSGNIQVRNGGIYNQDTVITYTAGTSYHIRIVGDITLHTYSVWVTPQGQSEIQIANNYAFRTEQANVTQLNNFSRYDTAGVGSFANVVFGPGAPVLFAASLTTRAVGFDTPSLAGRIFYVATVGNGGNDTANGLSIMTPWATIAKVNATTFLPGDTIAFNGNNTFSGGPITASASGTSALNAIKYTSYGTGKATITSVNSASGFVATNRDYITVNNLIFTGGGNATGTANGILFDNSTGGTSQHFGMIADNCEVTQFGACGIVVRGQGANNVNCGFTNVTISNNYVHNCTGSAATGGTTDAVNGNAAIMITAPTSTGGSGSYGNHNITVINNEIYACNGTNLSDTAGTGIDYSMVDTGLISGNYVHDGGTGSTQSNDGIVVWYGNNITIIGNEVTRWANNSSAAGIDLDAGSVSCIIEYNYVHECVGDSLSLGSFAAGVWDNNIVRFNIFQNSTGGEIYFAPQQSAMTNLMIYNNVFYNSNFGLMIQNGSASLSFTFANNIFWQSNGGQYIINLGTTGTKTFVGNNYYPIAAGMHIGSSTYTSLAAFQSAGYEKIAGIAVGASVNPLFIGTPPAPIGSANDLHGYNPQNLTTYQLQSTSPMIGGGIDLVAQYGWNIGTQDFWNSPIPTSNKNIGPSDHINPILLAASLTTSVDSIGRPSLTINSADPWTTLDGRVGASVIAAGATFPTILNPYGGFGARRFDQPTRQPPWQVAGVDYPVGINDSAKPLKPINTASLPSGVSFVGHEVLISGNNVVLDGYDLSVNGGYYLEVDGSGCTIRNCLIRTGASSAGVYGCNLSGANNTIEYCEFDGTGNAATGTATYLPTVCVWFSSSTGLSTLRYTYIHGWNDDPVRIQNNPTVATATVQHRVNNCLIYNNCYSGVHNDAMQTVNAAYSMIEWEFNFNYQPAANASTGYPGITTLFRNSDFSTSINSFGNYSSVHHNTSIGLGTNHDTTHDQSVYANMWIFFGNSGGNSNPTCHDNYVDQSGNLSNPYYPIANAFDSNVTNLVTYGNRDMISGNELTRQAVNNTAANGVAPPAAPVINSVTKSGSTLVIAGTRPSGLNINVYATNLNWPTSLLGYVQGSGTSWTFTSGALSSGSYTIGARAVDTLSNASVLSNNMNGTI